MALTGIFDSHAHYDDQRFDPDREELFQNLPALGVCAVINVGCTMEASHIGLTYGERYPYFYAGVGIHPNRAGEVTPDYIEQLRALSAHPKCVAIGEIGLDYHWMPYDKAQQQKVFREQVALAAELSMPVIIHSREATADTLEILREFPQVTGVVHCFSGSAETAQQLLQMGYYIGFTGVVTFPDAEKTRRAAASVPLDRLLVETDAPYMAPVPYRGKRCQSDMIEATATVLAELHHCTPQELVDAARENTCRLFGIALGKTQGGTE